MTNDSAHTPVVDAQPGRDERLLRELSRARSQDDNGLRADVIASELLGPYWNYIQRMVRWRLHDLRPAGQDVEDVAASVFERLARALQNKTRFSKPFQAVVLDNIQWACWDFRRQRQRRRVESLVPPEELPALAAGFARRRSRTGGRPEELVDRNDAGVGPERLASQAQAFAEGIEPLSARDRELLTRRFFQGMPPAEIALRLGLGRGALDTATHRALRKLSAGHGRAAVRNDRPRSEG
jgi:RNA polymerase sigma factor (sigma-70 family)